MKDKLVLRQSNNPLDSGVAYIELPNHPSRSTPGCVKETICLADYVPDLKGAEIFIDIDKDGCIIGLEVLY